VTDADRKQVHEALTRAQSGTSARIGVRIIPDAEVDAYERAVKEFETANLHTHEHRNAVLILVAPNAKRYAVIGDSALHARVGDAFWNDAVARMRPHFISGDIPGALIDVIDFVGKALHEHFSQ